MTITITHTYAEGTLLDGTSRADMPAIRDVLRNFRWKWSRNLELWFQQSSRDQLPRNWRIEGTARALRELGYEVDVQVDTTPRPMVEQEADREQRLADRQEALEEKAARRNREGQARVDRSDAFFDGIPSGQPVMGEADRRRRERHLVMEERGRDLQRDAARAAARAETAAGYMDRRYAPQKVASRVKRLETQLRRLRLYLDAGTLDHQWDVQARTYRQVRVPITSTAHRSGLETQAAHVENQLAYWRQIAADQAAEAGEQ